MSLQGVTCIRNGVISEYTSLQEWDHHRRQAQLLSLHFMFPQSSTKNYTAPAHIPLPKLLAHAAQPADVIAQCCRCKWAEMPHYV